MIKVLDSGIYCSVQDKGRFGFSKMGIPTAGVMDSYSMELGNILLQNNLDDAVIEITFGQGKFQFTKPAFFCLTGGDFSPRLNGVFIKMNTVYKAEINTILSFGKRNYGVRIYLAVQGGIQSEMILKSRSFSSGVTKFRLENGDELNFLNQNFYKSGNARIKIKEAHFTSEILKCFPGPEFEELNQKQKTRLMESFTISDNNNRMGYRLNETLENNLKSILTSSVLPGTVQLTPSGKLIILMKDCQITGGYPRVLQLSEESINVLGQKITNDKIKFVLK